MATDDTILYLYQESAGALFAVQIPEGLDADDTYLQFLAHLPADAEPPRRLDTRTARELMASAA